MPGGRATTRHADSALRSTKRAACAAAVGPERRDDERLRHERKLVDGRDPIGFRRASVIGVIGEWAFDHRRIGRSTAGLGRHLPQHTKSGWYTVSPVRVGIPRASCVLLVYFAKSHVTTAHPFPARILR
jgi:hypothetical protein